MGRSFPGGVATDKVQVNQNAAINDIFTGGGHLSVALQVVQGSLDAEFIKKSSATTGYSLSSTSFDALQMDVQFTTTDGEFRSGNSTMPSTSYGIYAITYTSTQAFAPALLINNASVGMQVLNTSVGSYESDAADNLLLGSDGTNTWKGLIAEYAMWKTGLSSDNQTALANGVNPFVVDRDNLELYIPMYGNVISSVQVERDYSPNHLDVTVTNTTKAKGANVQLLEEYV